MTTLVTQRPTEGQLRPFTFPEVRSLDLDGVRLRAVHVPGRPKARLLVVADAGAATESPGLYGVANLVTDTITRGAAGMGERELAIAFERLGTAPGTAVGFDSGRASIEAPAGLLGEAARLLAEVVRRPALRSEDVEDMRVSLIEEDRSTLTSPEAIASRIVRREVWADGARYGEAATGTAESLEGIDVEQVRAHHTARWADQPLVVVVAGDLDQVGDLTPIAEAFRADTGEQKSQVLVATRADQRRIVLGDRPGAAQSVLLASRRGPARGEPDAAALDVALAAVSGSFNSRLNMRLREELGYTYGARGGVSRRRHGGVFSASMSVRTEVTVDAVREMLGVYDKALADGLDEAETAQARDNLVRRYPVAFDGNAALASAVAELLTHDLPDDFHEQRLVQLREVTPESATEALRGAIRTDDLVIGVVGDGAQVRDGLVGLDLGEVVERQP